jgi:hypothetical protein
MKQFIKEKTKYTTRTKYTRIKCVLNYEWLLCVWTGKGRKKLGLCMVVNIGKCWEDGQWVE